MTQAATSAQAEVVRRVLEYAIPDDVIEKYMDKYGLTPAVAHEHERELKRYLAMCLSNREAAYGMFGPVDELWHIWILFTREWWEFGNAVAGQYVHHQPTTRKEKHLARSDPALGGYARFLADYPSVFGELPPSHLWPQIQATSQDGDCNDGGSKCWCA